MFLLACSQIFVGLSHATVRYRSYRAGNSNVQMISAVDSLDRTNIDIESLDSVKMVEQMAITN